MRKDMWFELPEAIHVDPKGIVSEERFPPSIGTMGGGMSILVKLEVEHLVKSNVRAVIIDTKREKTLRNTQ